MDKVVSKLPNWSLLSKFEIIIIVIIIIIIIIIIIRLKPPIIYTNISIVISDKIYLFLLCVISEIFVLTEKNALR